MSQHRVLSTGSRYYLPKEEFLTVVHYCRQYPLWIAELKTEPDASRAIVYDKDRVQTSGDYNPTEELAIRRVEIAEKVKVLEEVIRSVDSDLYDWLILGVCYGMTYFQLQQMGIPCGKAMYYDRRRRLYFEMSKKI